MFTLPTWVQVALGVLVVVLAAGDAYRMLSAPPEDLRRLREGRAILVIVLVLAGFFVMLNLLVGHTGWYAYALDGVLAFFAVFGIVLRTRLLRAYAVEKRDSDVATSPW